MMRMVRAGRMSCRGGWRLTAVAAALPAVVGVAGGSAPAAVVGWTRQAPATSPSTAIFSASMAYDAATGTDVLFGTTSGHAETWTWDGTTWTRRAPATSPPRQTGVAMASDAATGTVVLWIYGASYDQTWTWG